MKTLKMVGWYFVVAFFVWFVVLAAYGAASTDVKQSPLYSTEAQDTRAMFVHFPIFALLWPLWALFAYGVLEWLPEWFSRKFRKI